MKKVRTLGTKRWVCAILVCALLLTTPSLALAASAPEQTVTAQPLTLESIPDELAQTLELDELSPLAELNDTDEEQLNSLTISNGDGTSTAYIFQGPIKYLDKETNSIQFIDNKLKASDKSSGFLEKYAYENTANDIKVYLPKKIKKGVDMEYENISINMRPEIINNEKGVLKEYAFAGETMEVMEYPDAFGEGYHLQYQPISSGLKENILVEEYNGTNSFSFELKLKKGSAEISEDNRIIYIKDENGETVFILNQPYARDSYVGIDPELSHRTFDDYYILEQTGNKTYRVTMVIDSEFLAGEDTVYPVLIDPTANIISYTISDTTGLSTGGTTYGPTSQFVAAGYLSSIYYATYSKTSFASASKFILPSNVTSVKHKAYVTSLTNAITVTAYDSDGILNAGSNLSYSSIMNEAGSLLSSLNISKQGWVEFNITSLAKKWLKSATGESGGKSETYGYIFTSSGPGMAIMGSANHATYRAYISIDFNEDTTLSSGLYYIKNKSTGKYLTQDSGKTSVSAQAKTNSNLQLWEVTKVGGVYQIKNKSTSQYLGSPSGQPFSKNASPVIRTVAQKWRIVKNPGSGSKTYRIFAQNSQYSLENNSSLQSGTLVRATEFTTSDTRKWELVAVNGSVTIKDPTSSSIGYIRNYHEYFEINDNEGTGLAGARNAELTSIILDLNSPYSSKQKSVTLQAELTPSGSSGNIVWSSSNTNVATVNSNTGLVTAVGHGWATITARYSFNNALADSIVVIVPDTLMDVNLDLQEKNQWCWVTSVRMIMKYYFPEITASQEQGVRNSHREIDANTPESQINLPGDVYEAAAAATYYSNGRVEEHIKAFPSESELRAILDGGNPVYLTEHWTKGNETKGHARVIYGYYEYEPGEYVYLIHDPYQWDYGNIIIKTQMSYANMLDETDEGIEGIDKQPDNQAEWEPGDIIYWTVKP